MEHMGNGVTRVDKEDRDRLLDAAMVLLDLAGEQAVKTLQVGKLEITPNNKAFLAMQVATSAMLVAEGVVEDTQQPGKPKNTFEADIRLMKDRYTGVASGLGAALAGMVAEPGDSNYMAKFQKSVMEDVVDAMIITFRDRLAIHHRFKE